MRIKARSTPNIALIKYWGNRNNELRLPRADSLSITLDAPTIEVEIESAEDFSVQSFDASGIEKPQSEKSIARLRAHYELTKTYLTSLRVADTLPAYLHLVIRSRIPQAIGIASSAAVFSCLAEAYAGFLSLPLTREQISVLARLGSGSAARSVLGGFVALENIAGDDIGSARARQIAPEHHWILHDIILVPSQKEKKVGSTEGHAMAATSPFFEERLRQIPRRMNECIDAITRKDFEKLQRVSEEDTLDMHRCMRTQNPPLDYLSDETHRIIRGIEAFRGKEKLEVLYTMDAGPTVHLFCTDAARKTVEEYAETQKNCMIFKAKGGGGSRLIPACR